MPALANGKIVPLIEMFCVKAFVMGISGQEEMFLMSNG